MVGRGVTGITLLLVLGIAGSFSAGFAANTPEGELTYAMHVTLAPAWFDPGLNTGIISPKMVQYGLSMPCSSPCLKGA